MPFEVVIPLRKLLQFYARELTIRLPCFKHE
jgi:hypothetical protein